jgi:hypothetical protein
VGGKVTTALLPKGGGVGKPPRPIGPQARVGRPSKAAAAAKKAPTPPRSVLYSDESARSGGRGKSGGVGKKSGGGKGAAARRGTFLS